MTARERADGGGVAPLVLGAFQIAVILLCGGLLAYCVVGGWRP